MMAYKTSEKKRAASKAWSAANKERKAAAHAAWRAANKERHNATSKAWYDANKERAKSTNKAWREAHPERARALVAFRRCLKLNATPPWQSRDELNAIYEGCPEGFHVDHIHPLNGELSCGLNVPWNLQYLPDTENTAKGNKQPQPGYFDWFSEPWTVHAPPTGRVWTPTDYDDNI